MAVFILLLLAVAATCQAARPVGFYTFDGQSLRPLTQPVQRRSDDDGFPSFTSVVRNGWKLPFAKLAALTERDDNVGPTVSSDHLLPDYLTHQEFLKPQLQAAGFSGGRIIAGPFPVPLSSLPKPPLRSSVPLPPTPAAVSKHQKLQQQSVPPPSAFIYKSTPAPPSSYKPVQFPAVQSIPPKVAPVVVPSTRPSAVPQQSKLVYTIPTTNPIHWHAAHQSGPERPTSALGVPSYSHPATLVSESAGGSTRLSYGGWTPIYSASYAHVQTQQDPVVPIVVQQQPVHQQSTVGVVTIVEEDDSGQPEGLLVVPERQVVHQPEAPQSLDDTDDVSNNNNDNKPLVVDLVPRVIIPASSSLETTTTTTTIPSTPITTTTVSTLKLSEDGVVADSSPVVVVVVAEAVDNDKPTIDLLASSSSSSSSPSLKVGPIVTEAKRTVRKRKAKQVPRRRNSSLNQEVLLPTATASSAPSSSLPDALPLGRGQGQGRFVGRVLPASVFEDDGQQAPPRGWRQITRYPVPV